MARLYANENFPREVVEALRALGHDVLTVLEAGNAGQGVSDEEVLGFAAAQGRTVITLNRRDFIRLHLRQPGHARDYCLQPGCRYRGASRTYPRSNHLD